MGFKKGNIPWNAGKKGLQIAWNKGKKLPNNEGSGNSNYKGEQELEYKHAHAVVAKLYGKPQKCELCGRTDAIRYEWANVTGYMGRARENWMRMDKACHYKFDKVLERKMRNEKGQFIK